MVARNHNRVLQKNAQEKPLKQLKQNRKTQSKYLFLLTKNKKKIFYKLKLFSLIFQSNMIMIEKLFLYKLILCGC